MQRCTAAVESTPALRTACSVAPDYALSRAMCQSRTSGARRCAARAPLGQSRARAYRRPGGAPLTGVNLCRGAGPRRRVPDASGRRSRVRPEPPRRPCPRRSRGRRRARRRTRRAAAHRAANAGCPRPARGASTACRGRSGATRMRSPPARGRTTTGARSSAAAASPAPAVAANSSVPCGNASAASPRHGATNGGVAGGWTTMRPRWMPISAPSCASRTRASAAAPASCRSIASRRAADGARKPCCRRNQRSRLRARCGARAASAANAPRSSVGAGPSPVSQRRHRTRRCAASSSSSRGRVRLEARRRARAWPDSRERPRRGAARSRVAGSCA